MVPGIRTVNLRRARARSTRAKGVLAMGAALALGGCAWMPSLPLPEAPREIFTAPITNRGHAVSADQMAQITPGVTTRQDVQALLGTPSHAGTFTDDVWYYISSASRTRPARTLAVFDRRVVAVGFDERGVVRTVREVNQPDMANIAFVARETPTPGTEQTFLQRIFGGVGRVGPTAAATAGQQAPGAGPGGAR
jgi:outer membrane protein assembly factor BamE (lipoprotein component of BamABCDE complex)